MHRMHRIHNLGEKQTLFVSFLFFSLFPVFPPEEAPGGEGVRKGGAPHSPACNSALLCSALLCWVRVLLDHWAREGGGLACAL